MRFNTIFWGNSEFCLPTLDILLHKTNLLAIFTGQDKPIGRNQKIIKVPEPKEFGAEHSIPVYQEQNLKEPAVEQIVRKLNPDLMIVLSYGKIIPKNIYELPSYGTLNLHASLLPQYRGASPIQNSLLHGDAVTGVTLQKINDQLDHGNILFAKKISIQDQENYPQLRKHLSAVSAELIDEYLVLLGNRQAPAETPQSGEGSYCKKILKEHGKIQWEVDSAVDIINKWRAFYEWPGIYSFYLGKLIKFIEIEFIPVAGPAIKNGTVIKADKEGLLIQANGGIIKVLKIQPADKKPMDWISFLNGHRIKPGDSFI